MGIKSHLTTLFFALVLLSACKKNYTCQCSSTVTSVSISGTSTYNYPAIDYQVKAKNKSDALRDCNKNHAVESFSNKDGNFESTCQIK